MRHHPEYTFIGEGSYAQAYLSPCGTTVELIVHARMLFLDGNQQKEAISKGAVELKKYGHGAYFAVYDMSREAMISAKENAVGKKMKSQLPDISRKTVRRFPGTGFKPVFVYEMPFYDRIADLPTPRPALGLQELLERSCGKIYQGSGYSKNMTLNEDNPFSSMDPGELANINEDNLGVAKDGSVVFRDPLFCLFLEDDALRLFAHKFPGG